MRKRKNIINLTLMWFIGLLLLSHAIIPHHHHFDSIFDHKQQTEHSDEHSQHCHAFNILFSDNVDSFIKSISIHNDINSVIFYGDLAPQLCNHKPNVKQKNELPLGELCLNICPTRGSPVFI